MQGGDQGIVVTAENDSDGSLLIFLGLRLVNSRKLVAPLGQLGVEALHRAQQLCLLLRLQMITADV